MVIISVPDGATALTPPGPAPQSADGWHGTIDVAPHCGGHAVAVPGDVCEADAVDALFTAAADLGPVTGLVNNAGGQFPAPAENMFGKIVSGRGPAVPRATWVPADVDAVDAIIKESAR